MSRPFLHVLPLLLATVPADRGFNWAPDLSVFSPTRLLGKGIGAVRRRLKGGGGGSKGGKPKVGQMTYDDWSFQLGNVDGLKFDYETQAPGIKVYYKQNYLGLSKQKPSVIGLPGVPANVGVWPGKRQVCSGGVCNDMPPVCGGVALNGFKDTYGIRIMANSARPPKLTVGFCEQGDDEGNNPPNLAGGLIQAATTKTSDHAVFVANGFYGRDLKLPPRHANETQPDLKPGTMLLMWNKKKWPMCASTLHTTCAMEGLPPLDFPVTAGATYQQDCKACDEAQALELNIPLPYNGKVAPLGFQVTVTQNGTEPHIHRQDTERHPDVDFSGSFPDTQSMLYNNMYGNEQYSNETDRYPCLFACGSEHGDVVLEILDVLKNECDTDEGGTKTECCLVIRDEDPMGHCTFLHGFAAFNWRHVAGIVACCVPCGCCAYWKAQVSDEDQEEDEDYKPQRSTNKV